MNIRTVALAIFTRNDDEVLVQEFQFPGISTTFYRPVGGTVEFGENSEHTLTREIREELNQEIEVPQLVAVIENIFGVEETGHEIDFIYEAKFKNTYVYSQTELQGTEGKESYRAVWKSIHDFDETKADIKLVPDGLLALLTGKKSRDSQSIIHIRTR
ncbi:NUDIX hydrolase [Paenibacillus silvae]|uniref:NUDIX hydrolase n=1 Tax=Paenibacillus silvae TaxID=1325358 RepID=A0ABQ1ZDR4_9BACL|nr:NUDIX domain-containing protein [Paenibacillus silvae]GGH60444.1 NUDIX hydrolase [Paenibacillus silvae]